MGKLTMKKMVKFVKSMWQSISKVDIQRRKNDTAQRGESQQRRIPMIKRMMVMKRKTKQEFGNARLLIRTRWEC